jgi:predicted MPP superfamily phosphohydrolase
VNTIVVLPILIIGLVIYMLWEARWLAVKELPFYDQDLPEAFDGFRIIFLTDIHYNLYFPRKRLRRLVEQVNGTEPDLILLGGDYVDMSPHYIPGLFMELQALQARWGIYGVLGNHDYTVGGEEVKDWMKRAGITLLENDGKWLHRGKGKIKIAGVADIREAVPDLAPILWDVGDRDFLLLLSHNPDFAEELDTHLVNLVLSGHTHGGQITLFNRWAPLTSSNYGQRYRQGLVATSRTKVLISRGIGTVTLPFRFFARPEIWEVVLKKGTCPHGSHE